MKKESVFFLHSLVFYARACYNRFMDTRNKTMIGLGTALALSVCAAAAFAAPAAIEASAVSAPSLFLPGSYEEYLPLELPSDAAMSEEYIAAADGNTLYLFDREEGSYLSYTHTSPLSKLQFTEDGRLFFSDQDTQLYRYDTASGTAVIQPNVPCATFTIAGSTLYTAVVSNASTTLYAIPCDSAVISYDRRVQIGQVTSLAGASPRLTYLDGVLYCAFNHTVYACTTSETGYVMSPHYLAGPSTDVSNLAAFTAHEGEFYYAVNGTLERDGLYRTVLDQGSERIFEGSGFSALFSYDGTLYGVQNGSVRAFSLENGGASLTGYEIGAGSDAPNRISDAGETVRAGDLLVVADRGNRRVLLYDGSGERFSSVALNGVPACVATDGESFAVSVGNNIYLYTYGESEPRYVHTAESTVSGIACVYGTYYYVTEHSYYGVAEEGAREFTRSGTAMPVAITSDMYGNLYVASSTGQVIRFTESEFLDYSFSGIPVTDSWVLPSSFSSLRADYEGNLYYLSGNALYQNGLRLETFDVSSVLYHGGDPAPAPVSFALSFSDGTVYLNYGDFMVTAELVFPNLGAVSADGLYETLFTAPDSGELSYVNVSEGAVGVEVDVSGLMPDSKTLTYVSHARIERGTALVLGKTEHFVLAALYEDYGYRILLVPEESCGPILSNRKEANGTKYISSNVSLTSYPLFSEALTLQTLPRGTEVEVIAEVTPIDGYAFAEVRAGGVHGYVPLAYLTASSPIPAENDDYRLGYLKASDGITFYAADDRSRTIRVTERTQVKIYEAENGAFDVCFTDGTGTLYTAQVTEDMLESGGEDALRMSIIIILCVIAVGIGAVYVLLVPKKSKN